MLHVEYMSFKLTSSFQLQFVEKEIRCDRGIRYCSALCHQLEERLFSIFFDNICRVRCSWNHQV